MLALWVVALWPRMLIAEFICWVTDHNWYPQMKDSPVIVCLRCDTQISDPYRRRT